MVWFLLARRYASAVYAVVVCLSVRPSVCVSVCHKPALYQTAKSKITQTTPYDSQGKLVFDVKDLGEILTGSPKRGRQIEVG